MRTTQDPNFERLMNKCDGNFDVRKECEVYATFNSISIGLFDVFWTNVGYFKDNAVKEGFLRIYEMKTKIFGVAWGAKGSKFC